MATKPLAAGDLRHVIAIQSLTQFQDSDGNMVEGWVSTYPQVYAKVEPVSVREFVAAQAQQNAVTTRITIRYRAGVNPTMRIVHRGKVYDIEGVLEDADSGLEYMTLACSQGLTDGV